MKRKTRFVAIITAVLMCSLLSGCKSSDYKKAQELYSSGNYEEAQTVFFKLGDYEDSTQAHIRMGVKAMVQVHSYLHYLLLKTEVRKWLRILSMM